MSWFKVPATVKYYPPTRQKTYDKCWIVAYAPFDIANYYRSLLPKAWYVQPQKYKPHVTILRLEKEEAKDFYLWGKYHDFKITIEYENIIRQGGSYFWLNVKSNDIIAIRRSLGLSDFRFPDNPYYHLTIGNVK